MKIILFIQVVIVAHCVWGDGINKNLETYLRVGEYLKTHSQLPTSRMATLENSNNIGIGYNPLHGSPVCYTANCHMDGFRAPIFHLNYVQSVQGGCTTKLIPEHVTMTCLPGSESETDTQVIDTLDSLKKATEQGFDVDLGGKYKLLSASYKHSDQTRYMVDQIVQEKSEVMYTTRKISYARLSMFEPRMNLSDNFRYIIETLPCCEYDENVENYIKHYILEYFGYSYVTTLLLGGIAQQSIVMSSSNATTLEQNGVKKSQAAKLEFLVSFGMKLDSSQDIKTHAMLMKYVSKTYTTLFGGDSFTGKLEDWANSVKTNPVIIKFNIKYISDILTKAPGRFPNDPNITEKAKMIERVLNDYITTPPYCYGNNCSRHGSCQDTGYFQFGQCQCHSGWSGIDCSEKVTEAPKPLVLSGTLCGLADSLTCGGQDPRSNCPWNWGYTNWLHCSKRSSDISTSPTGTVCGYRVGTVKVLCADRDPYSDACPQGYQRQQKTYETFCYKTDPYRDDLPGTMCGIEVKGITDWVLASSTWSILANIPCDGYYPGRGSCPPGYSVQTGYRDRKVDCGFMDLGSCDQRIAYAFCSKN